MKRSILPLLFVAVFLQACSVYYHAQDSGRFLPQPGGDTLTFYKFVRVDSTKMLFIDRITGNEDSIFVSSFTVDSSFFDNYIYVIDSGKALRLYSEFYMYAYNFLFFDIKQDEVFGLGKKTGFMRVKKVLDAPDFYQKATYKSIGSALDTISWKDTSIVVLRVDVKNSQVFTDKRKGKTNKTKSLLHFYYYPGVGLILVKGNDYYEKVLNFKP